MSRSDRRIAATLAVLCFFAARDAAGEVVRSSFALPHDGSAVNVAGLDGAVEGPIRLRIRGTISSSLDGSQVDALTRRTTSTRFETDGPFVRLPTGARLVDADPDAHSYTFELPRSQMASVASHLVPIAARNLVTHTEMLDSCTGVFVVEVLGPTVGAMTGLAHEADAEPWSPMGLAALSLGANAVVFLGLFFVSIVTRRRRRPEARFLARARRAAQVVERDALLLGPAFAHVVTSAVQLRDTASRACEHLEAVDRALRRTNGMLGADDQRRTLETRRIEILDRLESIARRLEATATSLASVEAEQHRPEDVDSLLAAMGDDLGAAVAATEEAGLPA